VLTIKFEDMNNNRFKQQVKRRYGNVNHELFDLFFAEAIQLADNGQFEEALAIGAEALVFAKYADIGYAIIYLLGMLCQASLDNDQPKLAEKFFRLGMEIIELWREMGEYPDDIDAFLDLKIGIDEKVAIF
jgi:hypothetical protein